MPSNYDTNTMVCPGEPITAHVNGQACLDVVKVFLFVQQPKEVFPNSPCFPGDCPANNNLEILVLVCFYFLQFEYNLNVRLFSWVLFNWDTEKQTRGTRSSRASIPVFYIQSSAV